MVVGGPGGVGKEQEQGAGQGGPHPGGQVARSGQVASLLYWLVFLLPSRLRLILSGKTLF